ncbi:MAG: hypothetical protein KIT24_12770 [Phycisphaeraceae bacterium]|nr:hypothetical protein [Phycisphaeraceae bacterium]
MKPARVLIPIGVLGGLLLSILAARFMTPGTSASRANAEFLSAQNQRQTPLVEPPRWMVEISLPDGPPRIATDMVDPLGRPVTVSCASCHANMQPNLARRDPDNPPMTFHSGLHFEHGALTCVTCHNSDDYNALRLADGSRIDYPQVMNLCSQCHAPQARDYAEGLHGGMTGFWDRTRGPQHRKSCIDCHDPHAPQFPAMVPAFKPIDRFLESHD